MIKLNNSIILIVFLALTLGYVECGCCEKKERRQDFLVYALIDQCEGKEANNYTYIQLYEKDSMCSEKSVDYDGLNRDTLTVCDQKMRTVNQMKTLAVSNYPQGAYRQQEILYQVTSGPGSLEGKYVYLKAIWLKDAYLKKCSSILGYTYVTSKSLIILIGDKLDLNVFLSPAGAFETFKRGCTTICKGRGYIF